MKLVFYNPVMVRAESNLHLPGMKRFATFFTFYNNAVVLLDRTGTLKIPVRTQSVFPIPTLNPFSKTLEEVCNERACELLRHAEELGIPLYVLYSGGIDSTLVLVSLLKNATPAQKKNIIVLLSKESIQESPTFYTDYIRGRLRTESSGMFGFLMGTNNIFVGGECGDQLFGSDRLLDIITRFGGRSLHAPYSRDIFFTYFNASLNDADLTNYWLDMFERLRGAAVVPVTTNAEFIWWISFALKWHAVFFRMLSYASDRNAPNISRVYVATRYFHFYNTDDFQLWSMLNPDKKIKDTWRSYKWPCKDIIYDYTKDADYRDNKTKRGSQFFLFKHMESHNFIDDSFHLHRTLDVEQYYNPDNDFV